MCIRDRVKAAKVKLVDAEWTRLRHPFVAQALVSSEVADRTKALAGG